MDNHVLEERLQQLREQGYPLSVDENAANALVECIRRIMEAVPEDDQVFLRADYNLATMALCHPPDELADWN